MKRSYRVECGIVKARVDATTPGRAFRKAIRAANNPTAGFGRLARFRVTWPPAERTPWLYQDPASLENSR